MPRYTKKPIMESKIRVKPRNHFAKPDLISKVFENTLIFGKIADYLTFSELQVFSEVSRSTLKLVRDTQQFKGKARLIICKESYDTVRKTSFQWSSVRITCGTIQEKAELLALKRILRHVESVEIRDECYTISNTKLVNSLEVFISGSPSLRSLSLDCCLITKRLINVLRKKRVGEALKNVKELQIFKSRTSNIPVIESEEQEDFAKVVQELHNKTSGVTKFCFGKIDTRNSITINKALVDIVDKNKNTLASLTLGIQCWRRPELGDIVCPSLSSLSIVFKSRDVQTVKGFIQKQPALSCLSIQALDNFPLSLVEELRKRCSELTKLHLKLPSFLNGEENVVDPDSRDWSFLSTLVHLEDFSVIRTVDTEITPAYDENNVLEFISLSAILNNLQPKIKKIYVRGLEQAWQFEEEETVGIITTLSRFTDLQELSIFECENAINDEILQFICSSFTKLRVLQFSKCNTLTSFGYTGVREGLNTGISLKGLKGLRKLTIEDCTLERTEPLLESIKFLELSHLELQCDPEHSNFKISTDFAMQLARQNPSLEYLIGRFHDDEEMVRKQITTLRPSFKAVMCQDTPCNNSDAMTAYGFDEDGNRTSWMDDDSWGSGIMDYDEDDFDEDEAYGDIFDSDFDEDDYMGNHYNPFEFGFGEPDDDDSNSNDDDNWEG